MANDAQSGHSSGRELDTGEGTLNSGAKKVDSSGIRGSKRDSSSGHITSSPSSTRRSERLEKRIPPESPLVIRKSKRLEQQNTSSPLRRSGRHKTQGLCTHFGSKRSEKASSSVDRQKKKEKKEKSVEQLTMESVEVNLGENHDHEAFSLKRKKMTARSYKALFTKQRQFCPVEDSDDKLERRNLLPQVDSFDSLASGSLPLAHRENGRLQCGLTEIEPPWEGAPEAFASSLKDWNEEKSRNGAEPEFAYCGQSLSDKPPGSSDGADLGGSLIGCTNREIVDDVNKRPNDHSSNGKLQIPELEGSTSVQKGDISLESGEQVMQSESECCASHLQADVFSIVVNKDSSTQAVELASSALASTEHENDNFNGNSAVCSNGNLVNSKENFVTCGGKPDSSKFVEYWVPVPVSNVQLEQYCATLLANTITLFSSLKKDDVGALQDILMTVRKCCNHPYIVDPSLQSSIMKVFPKHDILDVGIKASGKLELLDMILLKIKRRKLRVLILFQTIAGSGEISIGNILDDFLRQRFGPDSYERIDACLPPAKRQDAMNRFNDKGGERFVLLLEHRACSSSLKLFSVDMVIIFDTEFNPANDIKDLQRMSIDSHSEQIKVFRLYSCYTLEEKVLILVKQHKNVQNNLQSANRATSDSLLMWGASVLFNRLDKFHAEQSTMSSADISSGQQWLLDNIVKNLMAKILDNSKDNCEQDSIISRAYTCGGFYHTDFRLLGEKEVQLTDGEERQIFWKKLLEGRNSWWKFWGPTPRSRKRVLYDENIETATKHQKVVDTGDNASNFQPELERRGQAAVSKAATNQSESLPVSVACTSDDKGNRDTNSLSQEDLFSNENDLAHPEIITPSDERRSLHMFLRAEMERLCEVLQLSMDIKHMVGTFLDYVMKNHHVNKEPASILQAFQISLCWTAASILKEKIDKGDSLTLAKKVLNFQCTEEEACSVYVKLRSLKKTFLQLPRNNSVSLTSQNVVSTSQGIRKQPPYAGYPSSASFDLQNVKAEVEERSSSLEPLDEQTVDEGNGSYADRKIKKLQKKCDKHMFQLHQKLEEDILEFRKRKEQEKLQLEDEHQLESALIRTTYPENVMRMDMLKLLDNNFKEKMQEHENLMEANLKELQARHSAEIEQKKKTFDDCMAEMKSCITSLGPEKVPSASPDTGKQNPDRIVRDYGAGNVISSGISVTIAADAVGSVVCSETSLCTPVNPVPDEVLETQRAGAAPVAVVEQPEETSQRSHQIPMAIAQDAVGCSLHNETSPLLLNSTSRTVLDTAIETSLIASAEQLKEANCFPHTSQDITPNVSSHGMYERTSTDLVTLKEQNSYEISSSSQNNEIPSGVPGTAGSEIGNAPTLGMGTSLEVETGDGGGNSMGSDTMGNHKDHTHSSTSEDVPPAQPSTVDIVTLPIIPFSEFPQKHACENTGQRVSDCSSSDCNQLTAEAVHHGHIEGNNSSPTPAASLQMVEGSVELPHQAVSQNGETVGLPPSIEGMDAGHCLRSQIEGSNSLPTYAASLPVERSVENSHQALSQNGETMVLPPSSEGGGPNLCANHSDLEIASGTDDGPNVELSAASQNILAPTQQAENIIRPPNQALLQSDPNLAVAEGPPHHPVHQMHRLSYRNLTLPSHAEPLQIELEMIRKDMEQTVKLFDSSKLLLKSECEKEIEETITQIRRKYEAKTKEAESSFLLKKTQLDLNHKKVFMNKILAEAFQAKCLDIRTSGNSTMNQDAPSSFIQHMHQLSLQPRLRHLSAAPLYSAGQPATSQQSAISPVQSLHRPSGPFASIPARPPQISAITPSICSLRVGGEIRAPAPHLQPFRPPACTSAASISCLPCSIPSQQLPASLPVPATSLSPPSVPVQQQLPSLPSQFLLKPNPPSQSPSLPPHSRINQEVSSNQPFETQNGVQPGCLNLVSAVELLMDIDDQAGGHLPNILQNLAGSGSNTNALDALVTRASCNANEGITTLDTPTDVVCLSDDDG